MKKLILCVFAAALVAQVWGMVSWMALPWHMLDFKQFNSDTNVTAVLQTELQGSGLYTLPNMDPTVHQDEAKMAEWNDKARKKAHLPLYQYVPMVLSLAWQNQWQ